MKDRLKLIRKTKGINQTELAKLLEVGQSTVGMWETGKNPITPSLISKICEIFGVRRAWLETGEGEMFGEDAPPPKSKPTLIECIEVIFESLKEEKQKEVLKAIKKYLKDNGKTQTNNGFVAGDMIQN